MKSFRGSQGSRSTEGHHYKHLGFASGRLNGTEIWWNIQSKEITEILKNLDKFKYLLIKDVYIVVDHLSFINLIAICALHYQTQNNEFGCQYQSILQKVNYFLSAYLIQTFYFFRCMCMMKWKASKKKFTGSMVVDETIGIPMSIIYSPFLYRSIFLYGSACWKGKNTVDAIFWTLDE